MRVESEGEKFNFSPFFVSHIVIKNGYYLINRNIFCFFCYYLK